MIRQYVAALTAILLGPLLAVAQAPKAADRVTLSDNDRARIEDKSAELAKAIADLGPKLSTRDDPHGDLISDVAIAHKAAVWALRHGEFFDKGDPDRVVSALDRGLARARSLAEGSHPWRGAKGGSARGYRSKVDGSVQPYAVYVPDSYSADSPIRLDVILHGRDAKLTEARFLAAHDGKPYPKDEDGLILHVYGRGNNAYRWAGESDVFEAIDAVRRQFRVDPKRVVLRGFSMGGAGAWHLGLHHPGAWCAVEAGAGFSETRKHANIDTFPEYQEDGLHIYDAVDYALNAFDVPIAGYGGEDDPQLRASVFVRDALEKLGVPMKKEGLVTRAEGIDFLQVVGAKMGHKVDPESAKVLKAFRDEHAAKGLDTSPKRIRFVTHTLKYPRVHWLSIEGMSEHYKPAIIEAEIRGETAVVSKAENVAYLAVERQVAETISLGGKEFPLRGAVKGLLPDVYFQQTEQGWQTLDYDQSRALQENARRGKHHGLQGPIDDAFTAPFLVVKGTGTPWNPRVQAWADARLDRFVKDWDLWMRGTLRVVNDTDVTPADAENSHLILFGDPGSNALIARLLPDLPLKWTRDHLELGGHQSADAHAPALIALNPLSRYHYVVLNSGHTFGEKDFRGTNALLFPKLGDWGVFRVGDGLDELRKSGYFDEAWKPK